MDENKALLVVWEAFYDHVLRLKDCVNNVEKDGVIFSFILEYAKKDKLDIYSKCGFGPHEFMKLDKLLRSVEQSCLQNIIAEYERFRLRYVTPSQPVAQSLVCRESPCVDGQSLGISGQPRQETVEYPKREACSAEAGSAEKEGLGRGKRKKIAKVKFDFLGGSTCKSNQNCVKPIEEVGKMLEISPKRKLFLYLKRKASKESMASSNGFHGQSNSSGVSDTDSQTSRSLTKAENKDKADDNFQINDSCVMSGKVGETQKMNYGIREDEHGLREITVEGTDFMAFSKKDQTFVKKSKNLSLDESKGRVVCCLGERIDQILKDNERCLRATDVKQESSNTSEETYNDLEAVQKDLNVLPELSLAPGAKAEPKINAGRPRGERHVDCDKLAPMMCAYCRKTFKSMSELSSHWRVEHKSAEQPQRGKLFQCPQCELKFSDAHTYKLHYRIHSGARPHRCPVCNRTFRVFKGLKDHMTSHSKEKRFCCPVCKKMFGSYRLLHQHKMRHKERQQNKDCPRSFPCEICGKTFGQRNHLATHMVIHTGEKPYQCSQCGTNFTQKSSLKTHMLLHTGEKNHACDLCGRRFYTNFAMKKHRRVHARERKDQILKDNDNSLTVTDIKQECSRGSGETKGVDADIIVSSDPSLASEAKEGPKVNDDRPHGERHLDCDKLAPMMCAYCRKTFKSMSELSSHWKVEHKSAEQPHRGKLFQCPECDLRFGEAHNYKLHYRIHSGARPHQCSVCNQTFRIFKGLKDHMTSHNEEKLFCCPICKKMFGSYRLLHSHKTRHKERPRIFTCEVCGKAFEKRPQLTTHMLIHTGEKPHRCSYCGICFNQKGSLNTHMRLHTGELNHVCDMCGRRFYTNVAMMTHRRRHTGEKPYKCDQCDYRAASSSSLKDHKSVHGTVKPYKCQVANCGKSFKRRSHLTTHHKLHVGVKPYICQKCGASFALTSDLQRHVRTNSCFTGTDVAEHGSLESVHVPLETKVQNSKPCVELEERDVEEDIPISPVGVSLESADTDIRVDPPESLSQLPENTVVIRIVREPGQENSDVVLLREEMDAILRLSNQL